MTRPNRVDGHISAKSTGQQVEHRLLHADMGLNANNEELVAFARVERGDNLIASDGAEGKFGDPLRYFRREFGDRRSQSLGVLLGAKDRQAERRGAVDESADVPLDRMPTGNQRHQLFLHVNDEQRGIPASISSGLRA